MICKSWRRLFFRIYTESRQDKAKPFRPVITSSFQGSDGCFWFTSTNRRWIIIIFVNGVSSFELCYLHNNSTSVGWYCERVSQGPPSPPRAAVENAGNPSPRPAIHLSLEMLRNLVLDRGSRLLQARTEIRIFNYANLNTKYMDYLLTSK